LPQIKKKRQTERNSDEHCTQHRHPKESHPQPPSFTLNEREEHDCRDDHVQSEESGDAIRKKIVHEHRHVQRVMLDDPGNELRIGQNEPEQTEHQVQMPTFHHAICRHVRVFVEQKSRDHPCAQGYCARSELRYNSSMATLRFQIVPNAKIDKVAGEHGGAIKIKLRAQAVEGKANAALCCFLADQLNISQRAIILEHGQRSRDKVIRIDGMSEEDVRSRLLGTL